MVGLKPAHGWRKNTNQSLLIKEQIHQQLICLNTQYPQRPTTMVGLQPAHGRRKTANQSLLIKEQIYRSTNLLKTLDGRRKRIPKPGG
jgi:hypothetical protein